MRFFRLLPHSSACLAASSLLLAAAALAQEEVIDAMEAPGFRFGGAKGRIEVVEGRDGRALHFSFPEEAKSVFATRAARATPEWDRAAGFSFWVKGDGSRSFGALQFIWNEDYSLRYDYAFPIQSTEWQQVMVPWRDLVPVLPTPNARPLHAAAGNAPSRLSQLWFGKWWYWREAGAHAFAIDDLRLERQIESDETDYTPAGAPLARLAAKLKARQPVTIVTMGDSLTDAKHWTNRKTNWPEMLKARLEERFGSKVAIVNPAIGGTQLRQNLVLLPLWAQTTPEPDLVTVCFGGVCAVGAGDSAPVVLTGGL